MRTNSTGSAPARVAVSMNAFTPATYDGHDPPRLRVVDSSTPHRPRAPRYLSSRAWRSRDTAAGPEHLGEAAFGAAAPHLHLPQPVLRHHVALARRTGPPVDCAEMCGTPQRSRVTVTGAWRPRSCDAAIDPCQRRAGQRVERWRTVLPVDKHSSGDGDQSVRARIMRVSLCDHDCHGQGDRSTRQHRPRPPESGGP